MDFNITGNISDNFNETLNESLWDEEEKQLQFKLNSSFGAWLVFMEMTLAIVGIVFNLTVVISIREKESLMNNTGLCLMCPCSLRSETRFSYVIFI